MPTTHKNGGLLGKILREPLLHFLFLGAGLFLLYAVTDDGVPDASPQRIVVDEAEVRRLTEQFQRTWMRPPTPQELSGLAEDFVKEEILYREALALGLDRNDLIIRRRMRQKMEFLNTDLVEQQEPSNAELQTYLDANPDKFRRLARFSFKQVYIKPEPSPADPERRAKALLSRIRANPALAAGPQALGDPTLLPPALERVSISEVSRVFGPDLAESVAQMEKGRWIGPYPSTYGLHLVHVTEREAGGMPALEEARALVAREWSNERRQEANERFYRVLRARYSVEIRLPEDIGGDTLAARAK